MKRLIPLFSFLLLILAATPMFAVNRRVVDDVIRMTKANVGDDAILTYVQNTRAKVEVTADDIIAMTQAGVSKEVIKAVTDEANQRNDGRRTYSYAPRVLVSPFYSPYYYYDPFWYGPSLSLNFGFGRGYGYRGGFYGGHYFRHR